MAVGLRGPLDQLLIVDRARHAAPWRMALPTAICFALAGAALLAIDVETKRWGRPAQWLALSAGVLAHVAVVAYLFGARSLDQSSVFSPVALHTALTMVVVCVGILYARLQRSIMRVLTLEGSTVATVARRTMPRVILFPLAFGWLAMRPKPVPGRRARSRSSAR